MIETCTTYGSTILAPSECISSTACSSAARTATPIMTPLPILGRSGSNVDEGRNSCLVL